MITQAYFDNIQNEILNELKKANKSIYVAVAWLTDRIIFNELCNKAKSGLEVELMLINDTINNELTSFNHNQLAEGGGNVLFVNPSKYGAIMHHKFCVIDGVTIITGSYNWSYKAQINDENIIITSEASELGIKFINEFNSIKDRILSPNLNIGQVDISKTIKRLDIIKSLILLDECDEILFHLNKLKECNVSTDLINIIKYLDNKEYSSAILLIEEYKSQQSKLSLFEDPELFALQLELNALEIELNAIENEEIEIEKSIYEFSIQYNQILGKTLLDILNLKKQLASTNQEKEQAKQYEDDFKEDYENKKDITINELSDEEKIDLKKSYREASMKCHPDKFINDPAKMELAQKVFISLTEAYKSNDLAKVNSILNDLDSGIININDIIQTNKKDVIKMQIASIKQKISQANSDLHDLKTSETFKIIKDNMDISIYLSDMKNKLDFELEMLQKELNNIVYNEKKL